LVARLGAAYYYSVRTLTKLLLLFTLVTAAETFLLFKIAQLTSWWLTLALIVVPGLLGAWLAKREGARALRSIQGSFAVGGEPAGAIIDGVLVLLAGILLLTPGVLTDLTGLLLLLPPVRRPLHAYVVRTVRRLVERRLASPQVVVFRGSAPLEDPGYEVIDAEDIKRP
jgi:UPF0716 protein FxsA